MRSPLLPPNINPKNKKPAGACCASGPMSTFSIGSLRTTQRTRHVAVMMMMPMRPEMIQNAHLLSPSLNKPALVVNLSGRQKTDMTNASFGCLTRFDFPSLLGYFHFVLGRGADPISSRARFSDQLRTPARKGLSL